MMLIKNAKHCINDEIKSVNILIKNNKITDISQEVSIVCENTVDFAGDYILPGFIDIHTHGCAGTDFNDINIDKIKTACRYYASQGVASFYPTILADSKKKTLNLVSLISSLMQNNEFAQIAGIHLEGPFLSKEYKGAMPEKYLLKTDIDYLYELQQKAKGNIKLITIAPEINQAERLMQAAKELNICVSLGHSGATYNQAKQAIDAGAEGATHLFNAMKPLNHHEGGIISACIEEDIYCELIGDGIHINKNIFRMVCKAKGTDNIIVVTDSIMAAGLSDGEYKLGINPVIVKNGEALLKNGARAGSLLSMNIAFKNIMNFLNITPFNAAKLISKNPAQKVLKDKSLGQIKIDCKADFVRIDKNYNIVSTYKNGKIIYSK